MHYFQHPYLSSRIADAGMAIESSGCEFVYISNDMGEGWGMCVSVCVCLECGVTGGVAGCGSLRVVGESEHRPSAYQDLPRTNLVPSECQPTILVPT